MTGLKYKLVSILAHIPNFPYKVHLTYSTILEFQTVYISLNGFHVSFKKCKW